MEPAINLYSSNEKSELIRENSQEIFSVLAAHQIALWEYDIITGKCSFSNDYFFTLGLKDAGIIFEDIGLLLIYQTGVVVIRKWSLTYAC